MSDDFDWDSLSPDDFATPVATSGTPLPPRDPDQSFDAFVSEHVESLRRTFKAAGDAPLIAYLTVGDREWAFPPTFGETIDQFVERVHVEAHMLGATMLFVSKPTIGGIMQVSPEETLGSHDQKNFDRLQANGLARSVMFYFAEHRTTGSEYRHGIMDILDGELGEPQEGVSNDLTNNKYAKILRA